MNSSVRTNRLLTLFVSAIVGLLFGGSAQAQTYTQIVKALVTKLDNNDKFVAMTLKDTLKLLQETIAAKTGVKFDIVFDGAAFKKLYPLPEFGDFLETEIDLPKLRNVQYRTLLNIILSQVIVSATFRIQNNRVIIFPGDIPPPLCRSRTNPMSAVLLKRMSWSKESKMKAGEALEIVSAKGDFTIMVSESSWLILNPESIRPKNQTIMIPKVENATYWQIIQHISSQIGGVPIVMADHVFIVAQSYPLSLHWP